MTLRFWGVRGSIPTPDRDKLGYGGNTPCLELRCGNQPPIILDGGTGIHSLSQALDPESAEPFEADIVFTHFHWDHIQGLPFLAPLHTRGNHLRFHSIHEPEKLKSILGAQMARPYFPVDISEVKARTEYFRIPDDGVQLGEVHVQPIPLRHPGGATGYRLESPRGAIVCASDHEHDDPALDAGLRRLAHDADLLIYDAQFTPEEYESRRGWGHSTWLEGARAAADAGVKQLALFHHDPDRTDAMMDHIVEQTREHFPASIGGREGLTIEI